MPNARRWAAVVLAAALGAGVIGCAGDGEAGTGTGLTTLTLQVTPSHDTLGVGQTRSLTARVTDGTGAPRSVTVAWMSLNSSIATVSAAGDVTGLATGVVGIVATIGSAADTASIVVRPGALVVEPNAVITAVGEQLQFSVETRAGLSASAAGLTIAWSSSDPAIATVDGDGTVTAVGAGDVTILASAGGQQGSAAITVRQKDIASLRVSPATSTIYRGASVALGLAAYDDANRAMAIEVGNAKWSSSNTSVLTVDGSGTVTGVAVGSAVVTARIGPKTATATVNVLAEPVATVAVTLGMSTLEAGQTTTATATLRDAAGTTLTGRTIAWQSSNPALATVTSSGLVTAVAKGSVTITAIAEGKTGSAPLTVAAKSVVSVAVLPNPAAVAVGHTAQLSAVAADAQGAPMTGRTFTWSSSNSAVATVSSTGLVTAIAAGSATISATTDGVSGTSSFTATPVTAASVSLSPSSSHVVVGDATQFVATAVDADGNVLSSRVPSWASSNAAVASVSSDGRVVGVSNGTANISATVDGYTATAPISVDAPAPEPVATVTVSLASTSLSTGQSTQASAVLRDANGTVLTGRTITWSSAAPELATVSSSGLVTAVAAGSATIVATVEGQSGSATLVIGGASPQPVASVTLTAASSSMYVGQSQTITVTLRDAQGNLLTGRTVAWSSSNLGAVTVSPLGVVQAVGVGTSTITATSEGKSGALTITSASAPVATVSSIALTATTTTLNIGQTVTVVATVLDPHGTTITGRTLTWSSSAPSVATVSSGGVVTAVAAGPVVIKATVDGVIGSLPMTVAAPAGTVATVSVSLASAAVAVGQTTQAMAIARDANGNAVAGTPTWASSNSSVATVSATGLVTATGSGTANITATISGKSGSASLTATTSTGGSITVTPPAVPRSVPSADVPAPTGKTIRVASGGDLQGALNSAQPGDVVALASGATFIGNFILPARACNGWVTVRTDVPDSDLPPAGRRMSPAYAGKLAKIMTNNNQPALRAAMPTCQWRLFGVEVAVHPSFTDLQYWLMALGDGGWSGGGEQQTSLDKVPTNIVLDRMYIHGQTTSNLIRCLALNSANTAVVNSYIDQCHARGFDSQAIEGWNGPGPYLIENNFVAGSGENIMFGGADPAIYGLSPSDITIRRNHVYKDPAWKGVWTVKNLFELKNARRVMIEGNIFENNWADAQAGMAIVIKSSHDACTTCTWQGTQDVTFRYNIVRNSPRGFNLQAVDGGSENHVARVRAEHNFFQNIGSFNGTGSDGWLMLLTHDLKDVTIAHNAFVHNVTTFGLALMMDYANGAARNIAIRDNVFTDPAGYAIMYSGTQVGTKSMEAFAGTSWSWERNITVGVASTFVPWHPQASFYPGAISQVGFVNPSGGDYRLATGSPYKGQATDGTDPGPDFAALSAATSGVITP